MAEIKRYVAGFALERPTDRILLVRKNKPSWQAGLLNGIGGGIEDGEKPYQAMMREWSEEVTYEGESPIWKEFAKLHSKNTEVHCFSANLHRLPRDCGFNDVGEELLTVRLCDIGLRRDMLKQLKWLVPLAFDNPDEVFVTAELLS